MQAPESGDETAKKGVQPDRLASPFAELVDYHDAAPSDHRPASMADEPVSTQGAASALAAAEGPATPLQRVGSLRRSGTVPWPGSIGPSDAATGPLVSGSPLQGSFRRTASGTRRPSQLEASLPRSVSLPVPSSVAQLPATLQRTVSAPAQSSSAEPWLCSSSITTDAVTSAATASLEAEQPQPGADHHSPVSHRKGERQLCVCGGAARLGLRGSQARHTRTLHHDALQQTSVSVPSCLLVVLHSDRHAHGPQAPAQNPAPKAWARGVAWRQCALGAAPSRFAGAHAANPHCDRLYQSWGFAVPVPVLGLTAPASVQPKTRIPCCARRVSWLVATGCPRSLWSPPVPQC